MSPTPPHRLAERVLARLRDAPPPPGVDPETARARARQARDALKARPDQPEALLMLGIAAHWAGLAEVALDALDRALDRQPGSPAVQQARGLVLVELFRFEDAAAAFRRVADLAPGQPDGLLDLGNVLKLLDDPAGAERALTRAHELAPQDPRPLTALGQLLKERDRLEEAEAVLRRAAASGDAEARVGLAEVLLGRDAFAEGWALWEARLDKADAGRGPRPDLPVWQGGPLAGRRLLVRPEQGLGDEVAFASCYPDLVDRGGSCVLECDSRLVSLFARSFPGAEVVADGGGGAADLQVMAGSVMRYLRPDRASFPQARGYLTADPERRAGWRQRLDALGDGPKIGVSWRSGRVRPWYRRFSSDLADWTPVLETPGTAFVSLQYGEAPGERDGTPLHVWDDLDLRDDLEEVAALCAELDLVISVGNSLSDLAGAVGAPVWELLPLPEGLLGPRRYWCGGRRFFLRGPDEGWAAVLARVAAALSAPPPAVARNAPCPCGSGRRYKHCHGRA